MPKAKGDYYRNPKADYLFYCPFCGKDVEVKFSENVWRDGGILSHLSLYHQKELNIRIVAIFEYQKGKGWVKTTEEVH